MTPRDGTEHHSNQPETETTLSFSLLNGVIERDWMQINLVGAQRFVKYSKPDVSQEAVRDELRAKGFILGRLNDDQNDEFETFNIPLSSVRLAYDSSERKAGDFTYNDAKKFHDLGRILAQTSVINSDSTLILPQSLEHHIATVDFTIPGKRKLFFSPGIEKVLKIDDGINVKEFYLDYLLDLYNDRFVSVAHNFIGGFDSGLEEV